MNRLERVDRAIAGLSVDRPPMCFWRHYGDIGAENTVKAHIKFFTESGHDLLKMMCDEFFFYPLNGAATELEFFRLKPMGKNSQYVRGQVERATQINEALKGSARSLYNAFSPYATLKHAMGDEKSMALIRNHPKAAKHAMDVICEDTCYLIEGILKESGTMGMMLPLQGAEIGRFEDDEYAEMITPTEKRVIDCAQQFSDKNLLHMCGWDGIKNKLERWISYPTRLINWAVYVEQIDIPQARELFGKDRVLLGGYDNRKGALLHAGTKQQIQQRAKEIVQAAGSERLIIGADCSLPNDIEPERIRWIAEAFEQN